jgi:hypothetical protein
LVVDVYVGRGETSFATVQENSDRIDSAAKFLNLKLPWIGVLPQTGPPLMEEARF